MSNQKRRIPLEVFKSIVAGGQTVPEDTVVVRSGPGYMQPVGGERRLLWCISTSAVDRMGDVIEVDGWDLRNYEAGGSVLWAHDPTTLPVAKPVKTYVQGDKLWSVAEYPIADISPFADSVYKLAVGGYLRGASIGMRPIEYSEDIERRSTEFSYPMRFKKQELLEWSHTPIPANPEALLHAKSIGVNLDPLRQWSERALDEQADLFGTTRAQLEKTYHITDEKKAIMVDMGATEKEVSVEVEVENESEAGETEKGDVNAMLAALLDHSDELAQAAQDGTLDLEKISAITVMLQSILANNATQATEEAKAVPEKETTTKAAPHGEEALAAKSHEDLTDDDIRGIVREVLSAGLSRRRRT